MRAQLVAIVALAAVLASLVPCEAVALAGESPQMAAFQSESPAHSSAPSQACADNCPCLCAGACSAALAPRIVALAYDSCTRALISVSRPVLPRVIPQQLFHPPRLHSVI